EKIADLSACFLDENDAGSCVPTLQAKFPETVEASRGNTGEIKCGRAVAADSVGTECEIVVVVNVGAGLTFVYGKTSAEKAGRESRNFGDGNSVAVAGCALAAGCSVELLINRVVNHTDKNLIAMRKGDGHTEARVSVGEIRCAVEGIDVPAILGVVILAEAFLGGDGVRRKIF